MSIGSSKRALGDPARYGPSPDYFDARRRVPSRGEPPPAREGPFLPSRGHARALKGRRVPYRGHFFRQPLVTVVEREEVAPHRSAGHFKPTQPPLTFAGARRERP